MPEAQRREVSGMRGDLTQRAPEVSGAMTETLKWGLMSGR